MNASPYEQLRRTAAGFMLSSILTAAAELDCFTLIIERGNSCDAQTLARAMGTDPRGTMVFLDALAASGFLRKKGLDHAALYSVVDEYLAFLDSRHPETFVPMLRLMANGQRTWSRLTWALKDGQMPQRQASILGPEADRVSFILGMNSIAMQLVGPTVQSLGQAGLLPFDRAKPRLLDIGGASGTYAQALLEAVAGAEITIFDLPVGIGQARKRFADSEFADRVRFAEGDFMQSPLPSGYDFAWLSAIIHSFSRDECVALYRNIHQALVPGGVLAVRDYFMSPDRISPPDGALFGLNMFLNTPGGRVHTFDESKQDLELAGFTDVRLAVPSAGMSSVVAARKI